MIGGANRDRTDDLKLAKLALSQLSYGPVALTARVDEIVEEVVGLGRLELPTSRLSSARSNQLSYKPGTSDGRDSALSLDGSRRAGQVRPERKRNEDGKAPHNGSEDPFDL